jgi:hypothetical protein
MSWSIFTVWVMTSIGESGAVAALQPNEDDEMKLLV